MIKPQAFSRASLPKLRLLVFGLFVFAAGASAHQTPATDAESDPLAVRSDRWDDRFAKALGLSPVDRYDRGVLRFSWMSNSPKDHHFLLEIADLGDGAVLFRRIEAEGQYHRPNRVVRASERKAKAPFRDMAFAMLDKLTAPKERAGIVATDVHIICTSDHGDWIAVSVETRDQLAQSLTRYHSCRGSVEPPGGLEALGVKVPPTPPPTPRIRFSRWRRCSSASSRVTRVRKTRGNSRLRRLRRSPPAASSDRCCRAFGGTSKHRASRSRRSAIPRLLRRLRCG